MDTPTSSTVILSTGGPQGCVLSPLLFTLYPHGCAAINNSNTVIKFTEDSTVKGLISSNDEAPYREEVQAMAAWCSSNDLNIRKTKETITDLQKPRSALHVGHGIDGDKVERVTVFKVFGLHILEDLDWIVAPLTLSEKPRIVSSSLAPCYHDWTRSAQTSGSPPRS